MRPRGTRGYQGTIALAGWLFADLLLGLAMLFFVFNTVGAKPTPTPTKAGPTHTHTPTPSRTPSPTFTATNTLTLTPSLTPTPTSTLPPPPPLEIGLSQTAVERSLRVDPDLLLQKPQTREVLVERDRIRAWIRREFSDYNGSGCAGFVLTFGTSSDPNEGNALAGEINRLLIAELPAVFNRDIGVFRDFHDLNRNTTARGVITLEVYLLLQCPTPRP